MIINCAKSRGIQITTIFKFFNFTAVFTQSKAHLSDRIDRECTFQIQTSNSLSISVLRMNTDPWVNLTILILLALCSRIIYEWLFQKLRKKYVSKLVGWKLSHERNVHEQLSLILLIQHFKVSISLKACEKSA